MKKVADELIPSVNGQDCKFAVVGAPRIVGSLIPAARRIPREIHQQDGVASRMRQTKKKKSWETTGTNY